MSRSYGKGTWERRSEKKVSRKWKAQKRQSRKAEGGGEILGGMSGGTINIYRERYLGPGDSYGSLGSKGAYD